MWRKTIICGQLARSYCRCIAFIFAVAITREPNCAHSSDETKHSRARWKECLLLGYFDRLCWRNQKSAHGRLRTISPLKPSPLSARQAGFLSRRSHAASRCLSPTADLDVIGVDDRDCLADLPPGLVRLQLV